MELYDKRPVTCRVAHLRDTKRQYHQKNNRPGKRPNKIQIIESKRLHRLLSHRIIVYEPKTHVFQPDACSAA